MKTSESIGKLALALSKAQAVMRPAVKDAENPFFKSNYADLESVWNAIREPLAQNELSVSQLTSYNDEAKHYCINTLLMHSSGEYILGSYPLLAKDTSPQAMGSATSYARRYALAAALGVTQADEDAEAAQKVYRAPNTSGFVTTEFPKTTSSGTTTTVGEFPKCPECGTKMLPSKFPTGAKFFCPQKKSHKSAAPALFDDDVPPF